MKLVDIKLENSGQRTVGWTKILPFDPMPHILHWGERVFRYVGSLEGVEGNEEKFYLYREGFSITATEPVTPERT